MDWLPKILLAAVPLVLGALTTIAWQNSHALATLAFRFDTTEKELAHLRGLVEQRLTCQPQK